MKTKSILLLIALVPCAASLLTSGCASKSGSSASAGASPSPGYYGSSSGTYSPMPMNKAAQTDAMRQAYRNEFR